MSVYLIYSNVGSITGRRLGRILGVEYGQNPEDRYDYLLRWGSSERVRYKPSINVINSRKAISKNADKLNSLKIMKRNGIQVPKFSSNVNDLRFPLLSRTISHSMGRNINLVLQRRDLNRINGDYYMEYIPKDREYRLHIINNECVKISQKVYNEEGDNEYNSICWNYENGFRFVNPRINLNDYVKEMSIEAVNSLGLDFGAVDLIISEDNSPYVLEVNTCPGLSKNTIPLYVRKLSNLLGNEVMGMGERLEYELNNWEELEG